MKVHCFIPSLGTGGAERVAATLASHWVHVGWDVTVVTLAPLREDRYALDPAVRRIALDLSGQSGSLWAAVTANARRVRALRSVIRRDRPDVVLAMMGTPSVLLAFAAVGLRGTLLVGSERIHPPRLPLGRAWEWLRAWSYGWLDAVVVQTIRSKEWLQARTSAQRVVVIPNPVVVPLPAAEPVRLPSSVGVSGRRRLLAAGRLDRQKGYDLLLEAFASVATSHPEWELVVVGEGQERGHLEAQAALLGLGGRAILAGRTGNLGDWYSSADLFVLSSRFEGFPNALVEAMAHGLAVVAFDCETGPAEIVRHDIDGLLVAPEDVRGLGAALDRAMADPALRLRLGARAIEVRARYALPEIHRQWSELFAKRQGQSS